MLIRASGGRSGIGDYLRNGIKNGREHTRDELDHRIVLEGDLETTELIINGMNPDAQRYLHITLSFKEDHVDNETMSNIVNEFKTFAMKAYNEEEYNFYAEAHVPKIKSVVDKKTKELIERKPHIHVVIPEYNLATYKRLEPFGLVELNTKYIDAFQEVVNEKYGLASPKMNIRSDFTSESTIIERCKGDTFKGVNKAIKEEVLKHVLTMPSSSLSDLSAHLIEQGYEVKERNKGKENNYLNIKEEGKSKGVNLNDTVFTERFLSLPIEQKQQNLSSPSTHNYIAPEQGNYQATEKHHADLAHWNEHRSHEVRHVKFRNRAAYKAMSTQEKTAFIQQKKKAFLNDNDIIPTRTQRDCVADINRNLDAAKRHLSHAQRDCGNIEPGARNIAHRRDLRALRSAVQRITGHQEPAKPVHERLTGHSRVIQQIQSDIMESELEKQLLPDIAHIKKQLNATELLRDLSQSHGLITQKYVITQGKDGSDRIVCGTRQLNVADFLTKEMGLSWKEAKQQLEHSFARQRDPNAQKSTEHDREDFSQRWQPSHKKERKQAWKAQYDNEKAYRFAIRKTFSTEKNAIYADDSLSKSDRKIALSISRMNKVIADMEFIEQREWDRNQLKQNYPNLITAQYQRFEQRHTPIESLLMNNSINGTIEEHGTAPYEFNKENKQSYYIKLKLPNNQVKTIWGTGLRDAIKESNSSVGHFVSLTNAGQRNVTVENEVKDEFGKVIDVTHKHTYRNEWVIQNDNKAIEQPEEEIAPISEHQAGLISAGLLDKRLLLDRNLEASRLLIMYPKLKELGINAEHISKTDRGERIQFNDKSLTISQLMKQTHQYETKQIVAELMPIYSEQERDKQQVDTVKNPTIQSDINQAISLNNEAIELENKGLEEQAADKEYEASMLMYSIAKTEKETPFNAKEDPRLHQMFIKVKSELMVQPQKETPQPAPVNKPETITKAVLDKKLEASRLLIMYPKLKELGINAEHISKTEKGDRIQFNDKSLTVTELMKETHQLKPKQIVDELTPIYSGQERDKQRVIDFANRYINDPSNKIDAAKEKPMELTISSGQPERENNKERDIDNINEPNKPKQEQHKDPEKPQHSEPENTRNKQAPLPPQDYENITHQTNEKGHVTYLMDKEVIVVDRGENVHIAQNSDKAIEIGLRLSMEKFGNTLDIRGTEEYKEKLVEVAVKNNLSIQFSDPKLNEMMKEKAQQFRDGENIIQKAERDYKQENEPQKAPTVDKKQSHNFDR